MALHGTVSRGTVSSGTVSRSTAISGTARHAGAASHTPLPWPAAALTIGTLSAGLWLGIGWVVASLF